MASLLIIFMRDRYVRNTKCPLSAVQGHICSKTAVMPVCCHNKYNVDLKVGQNGEHTVDLVKDLGFASVF